SLAPLRSMVRVRTLAGVSGVVLLLSCASSGTRKFPDRPIAWQEHDDEPLARAPAYSDWGELPNTATIVDGLVRETDRHLALEAPRPARDVNADDEVACSTWFCPKNHVHPLAADEIARGAPDVSPPELPLTILRTKPGGDSIGFVVDDARG